MFAIVSDSVEDECIVFDRRKSLYLAFVFVTMSFALFSLPIRTFILSIRPAMATAVAGSVSAIETASDNSDTASDRLSEHDTVPNKIAAASSARVS